MGLLGSGQWRWEWVGAGRGPGWSIDDLSFTFARPLTAKPFPLPVISVLRPAVSWWQVSHLIMSLDTQLLELLGGGQWGVVFTGPLPG